MGWGKLMAHEQELLVQMRSRGLLQAASRHLPRDYPVQGIIVWGTSEGGGLAACTGRLADKTAGAKRLRGELECH